MEKRMLTPAPASIPTPSSPASSSPAFARAIAILCLSAAASAAISCSSSSDEESPFAEYAGTWRVEFGPAAAPLSTFGLSCTTSMLMIDIPLWDKLVFEPGTVSDLVETAGPSGCQFAFDVEANNGTTPVEPKTASVPATDPYTNMPSGCTTLLGTISDPAGVPIDVFLDIVPTSWKFKLLTPVKGKAPTGQLIGSSNGRLVELNTMTNMAGQDTTCVYSPVVNLTKIAQN